MPAPDNFGKTFKATMDALSMPTPKTLFYTASLRSLRILFGLSGLLVACAHTAPAAHPAAHRAVDVGPAPSAGLRAQSGDPSEVVQGTDFYPLSHFAAAPVHFPAQYSEELGGAELKLRLTVEGSELRVVRAFIEPGADPGDVKTYRFSLPAAGAIEAVGIGVKLLGVPGGVLVHETNSDTHGIDADAWYHYGLDESEDSHGRD